jgi:hypothetical protein
VIPHYDNREGGTHDTRFCYLGETRLAGLEEQLPDDVGVLGVDEHTAAVIDVAARTMTVTGNGLVTVRRRGRSRTLAAGESLGLDDLAAMLRGEALGAVDGGGGGGVATGSRPEPDRTVEVPSLRAAADEAMKAFEAAFGARDVEGCIGAALGLEQTITDWHADTLQSDDMDHARRVLRAMVVRLGELAELGADPRGQVAPVVDLLVDLRGASRERGDFATSDLIRDRLGAAGIELRDTPDGPEWSLRDV